MSARMDRHLSGGILSDAFLGGSTDWGTHYRSFLFPARPRFRLDCPEAAPGWAVPTPRRKNGGPCSPYFGGNGMRPSRALPGHANPPPEQSGTHAGERTPTSRSDHSEPEANVKPTAQPSEWSSRRRLRPPFPTGAATCGRERVPDPPGRGVFMTPASIPIFTCRGSEYH